MAKLYRREVTRVTRAGRLWAWLALVERLRLGLSLSKFELSFWPFAIVTTLSHDLGNHQVLRINSCSPGLPLCDRLARCAKRTGELFPPSIPRAIERGLKPDGDLEEELESIQYEPITTTRQAKAVVQLLKALPLHPQRLLEASLINRRSFMILFIRSRSVDY